MDMETQICRHCKETLPLDNFVKNKNYGSGYTKVCKPCSLAKSTKSRWDRKKGSSPLEHAVDEPSVKGAELVLDNMGFELYNHDNPVHSQFYERIEQKYGVNLEN